MRQILFYLIRFELKCLFPHSLFGHILRHIWNLCFQLCLLECNHLPPLVNHFRYPGQYWSNHSPLFPRLTLVSYWTISVPVFQNLPYPPPLSGGYKSSPLWDPNSLLRRPHTLRVMPSTPRRSDLWSLEQRPIGLSL